MEGAIPGMSQALARVIGYRRNKCAQSRLALVVERQASVAPARGEVNAV